MAINALQKAIYQKLSLELSSDISITFLKGSVKIFDHQVKEVEWPYIIFSDWQVDDWSTASENGEEHKFSIEIWDKNPGRKKAQEIARKVKISLHDQALNLEFGHLVNLRFENVSVRFQNASDLHLLRLNFRAIVEF